MNEVNKELDLMMDALTNDSGVGTSVPSTDSPSTDAPSTNSPSTDAPSTEAPSTVAPATGAPTTEPPKDDETGWKAEKELLLDRIKKLEEEKEDDKEPTTDAPTTEAPIDDVDFLGDLSMDDISDDPKTLNNILNNVFKKGVEFARNLTTEGTDKILSSLPETVNKNMTVAQQLKETSDKFYGENKDLVPFKKVVAVVFDEITGENPKASYAENLKKVGPEVRKRLGIDKNPPSKPKDNPPKLPSNKGNQRPTNKPSKSSFASELDEMDKALES